MKLVVFSDTVCTWSYGEEKSLRAIDYIYGENVEIENIMGGLIADYHDILPMNMKDNDSDEMANKILLQIWQTGSNIHKMPIMTNPPKLLSRENPSTYSIDKAFVAARECNKNLANKFLRKLREATLLDGLNTMDKNICADIAENIGIDREEYLNYFNNFATEKFLEDRMSTFDRRMTTFPNFMYTDKDRREIILRGYKSLEDLIKFIDSIEELDKREIKLSKENIYKYIEKYERVFPTELDELFVDREVIREYLMELEKENRVKINKVGNGEEILII